MDNLSYIIGLNNGEGGGGASSWSDIDGKPFNTVGTGLTTTGKVLAIDSTVVTDSDLATVATTGDYDDLLNKPTIPFSSIGNGLTITAGGALQEAVPIYSESTAITVEEGMNLTNWIATGHDADCYFNMPNNATLTLLTGEDKYTVTANINGTVMTGSWTATDEEDHTYGGYTWNVLIDVDGEEPYETYEFYIDWYDDDENDKHGYKAHLYLNNSPVNTVSSVVIIPQDPNDTLETQLSSAGTNVEWGQATETVYHKLPADYVPIEAGGVLYNHNGTIIGAQLRDGGNISVYRHIPDESDDTDFYYSISANLPDIPTLYAGGALGDHGDAMWTDLDGWYDYEGGTNYFYCTQFVGDTDTHSYWLMIKYKDTNRNVFTTYGKLVKTYSSGTLTLSAVGFENVIQSITFGQKDEEDCFIFVPKSGIDHFDNKPHILVGPDTGDPIRISDSDKQNINAYFLPLDNDTIKTNSDGKVYVNGATLTTSWNNISDKPAIQAGTGTSSIVEGHLVGNTASGYYSHAEGNSTTASGTYSHAEGAQTVAKGMQSHAEGVGTIAFTNDQHAQGRWNIKNVADHLTFADIVGNGTADNARSNAEATDWNGNKYLAGDVYVGVTNWGTTPTVGATKLPRLPECPTTTAGTFTLQAVVDGNGNVTYSWV